MRLLLAIQTYIECGIHRLSNLRRNYGMQTADYSEITCSQCPLNQHITDHVTVCEALNIIADTIPEKEKGGKDGP